MSKSNRPPTAEELDRASRYMRARYRNLDEVHDAVLSRFLGCSALHDFQILPQGESGFRAYVFFKKTEDIEASKTSGVSEQIVACVYSELERIGRGGRGEVAVAFEFDSDENVAANFEGNYFLRLR